MQANPAEEASQPLQNIIAQEQATLATSNTSSSSNLPPSYFPSSPAPSAAQQTLASTAPAPTATPQTVSSGEDALIQQVSGKTVIAPAKAAPARLPVFAPIPTTAKLRPTTPALPPVQPTPMVSPVVATAGDSSDAGLELLPSRPVSCGLTAGCFGISQSSPVAQSSPLPPPPGVPSAPGGFSSDPSIEGTPQTPVRTESNISPPSRKPLLRSSALSAASIRLQGVYIYQGDDSSARGRLAITYPLSPRLLFGATFDVTDGNAFSDSREQGFNVNELYLATSFPDLPNLRFVIGQVDLTSYFDRNSFAKDGASHFFNPVFQTNPALSATGLSSRPTLLANWAVTDNVEAKAAVFSSSRNFNDFALDSFAGEVGIRYGNLIVRGTYATGRDSGSQDGFREIFRVPRKEDADITGPVRGDREESYGLNAELFIPELKMGIFARYGRYENVDLGQGGDTYSAGISFLDLFSRDDRLGIAYGRGLSNDNLRRRIGDKTPDVLEVFYDFRFLPNLRLGFTLQQRNDFSETIAGVRLKTEFDVTPFGRLQ